MQNDSLGDFSTVRNKDLRLQKKEVSSDDLEKFSLSNFVTRHGEDDPQFGIIDRYNLLKKLGQGGFGSVYLAFDTEAEIEVAIKVLPIQLQYTDADMEGIRKNFALISKLMHPHIAGLKYLHRIEVIDKLATASLQAMRGDFMVVMEYVQGASVSAWRKQFVDGCVPVDEALRICSQIADALDFAHSKNIIHRDIKPDNVMIGTDGVVKVLDFGLAAEIGRSLRESGDTREGISRGGTSGTRPYMAPEQWSGDRQVSATDQYSLAVLFYQLVSGRVPFQSAFMTNDVMIMMATVKHSKPKGLAMLNRSQNRALARGLAKSADRRFTSCGEFMDALANSSVYDSLYNKLIFRRVTFFVLLLLLGGILLTKLIRPNVPEKTSNPPVVLPIASKVSSSLSASTTPPATPPDVAQLKTTLRITAKFHGRVVKNVDIFVNGNLYKYQQNFIANYGSKYRVVAKARDSKNRLIMGRSEVMINNRAENLLVVNLSYLPIDLQVSKRLNSNMIKLSRAALKAQQRQLTLAKRLEIPVNVRSFRSGIEFALIPPGSFVMGSPIYEIARNGDESEHRVNLDNMLYVSSTEITVEQWKRVMGTVPKELQYLFRQEKLPVREVSWLDCQNFCKRLCKLEGVAVGTYRLLSEAEWEYCCRAGTDTALASGALTVIAGACANLDKVAWYNYNSPQNAPSVVGKKQANSWGLYDMHGNIWEWCLDCAYWQNNFVISGQYKQAQQNPVGIKGKCRIFRGGSWYDNAGFCRSATRNCLFPDEKTNYLGLRICRVFKLIEGTRDEN